MYACMAICIYIYTCMALQYVCIHEWLYTYIYIYTHMCIYIYMRMHGTMAIFVCLFDMLFHTIYFSTTCNDFEQKCKSIDILSNLNKIGNFE